MVSGPDPSSTGGSDELPQISSGGSPQSHGSRKEAKKEEKLREFQEEMESQKINEEIKSIKMANVLRTVTAKVSGQFLSNLRIEEMFMTTLAYGHSGKAKLLRYDVTKLVRWGAFVCITVKGTVFSMDDGLIKVLLCYSITTTAAAVTGWFVSGWNEMIDDPRVLESPFCVDHPSCLPLGVRGTCCPMADGIKMECCEAANAIKSGGFSELSWYMNRFVPFVLGLYLSLCLTRWWALRMQALQGVFDAFSNTVMVVTCHLPSAEWDPLVGRIIRYGMASVNLLVIAARTKVFNEADVEKSTFQRVSEKLKVWKRTVLHTDSRAGREEKKTSVIGGSSTKALDALVNTGILEPDERDILIRFQPFQRAMIMWCWILRLIHISFSHMRIGQPIIAFLDCEAIKARDAFNLINTYMNSQLPFAYVHLITILVNINNLIISIKCGLEIADAAQRSEYFLCMTKVMLSIIIPVLYHGLMSISYVLHDPFGEDLLDFPIAAYSESVATLCDSFILAQDNIPWNLSDAQPRAANKLQGIGNKIKSQNRSSLTLLKTSTNTTVKPELSPSEKQDIRLSQQWEACHHMSKKSLEKISEQLNSLHLTLLENGMKTRNNVEILETKRVSLSSNVSTNSKKTLIGCQTTDANGALPLPIPKIDYSSRAETCKIKPLSGQMPPPMPLDPVSEKIVSVNEDNNNRL